MAARTASVTGNWSDTATWGGAAPPVSGDTASINAGITVTVDVSSVVGASGASGTTALTLAGAGAVLAVNAPLEIKGDLSHARGASVTGSAGGSITFTPPGGSQYKWIIAAAGSGAAIINLAGSAGTRFTVTTSQGAGSNTYLDCNTNDGAVITTNYVTCSYFGDASTVGWNCAQGWNTLPFTIQNTLFDNCGTIKLQYIGGATAADFIVNGVDFRNSLVTGTDEVFRFRQVNTYVSGTRSITNVTAYIAAGKTCQINVTAPAGVTVVSKVYSYNVDIDLATANGTAEKLFMLMDSPRVGASFLTIGGGNNMTVQDSAFYSHVDNPHYIGEAADAGLGKNTYQRNTFDGDDYFGTDAGDLVIPAAEVDFLYNIGINRAGTLGTQLNATGIGNYKHNTMYKSYGLAIGETTGGATQAKTYESNLVVSPYDYSSGVAGGDGVHQQTSFVRQSNFTLDYNGYFGTMSANAIAYVQFPVKVIAAVTLTASTTTTLVKASGSTFVTDGVQVGDFFFNTTRTAGARILSVDSETQLTLATAITGQVSTDTGSTRTSYWSDAGYKYGDDGRGLHDINQNPNFVAPTRTIPTWATALGVTASPIGLAKEVIKLNGFAFDASAATANALATVELVSAYIQAGFVPTNVAYQDAGHDSVTTGALEGVFAASGSTSRLRLRWRLAA